MSTPTPQPVSDAATVWQFRFLICRDRNAGQQMVTISGAKRRRTQFDAFHGCQSYLCADYAEYELLLRTVVGKTEKSFWGIVELYDPATGTRRKIDDTMRFELVSQQQDGKGVNSPGSYPGAAGSTPAPATSPAGGGNDEGRMPNDDLTLLTQSGRIGDEIARQFGAAKSAALTAAIEETLSQTPEGDQSGTDVVKASASPEGTLSNEETRRTKDEPDSSDADAGTPEGSTDVAEEAQSPAPTSESHTTRSARAPASKKPAAKKGKK